VSRFEAQGDSYEAICLLQPTNPLRTAEDIDACIEMLERSEADAVVTMLPVPSEYNPHWVYFQGETGKLRLATGEINPIPRRQDLPAAFHREGSVYVTKRDVLMQQNSLYGEKLMGYLMSPERCVNVDEPMDLERAAMLLRNAASKCPIRSGVAQDSPSKRMAAASEKSTRINHTKR
jgi:CMP-N-acetylneuraminic acid synthetase